LFAILFRETFPTFKKSLKEKAKQVSQEIVSKDDERQYMSEKTKNHG
jgi:predicted helicase